MKSSLRLVLGFVLAAARLSGVDFYVSPQGNDGNDGSARAPFATIARARDAARSAKAAGLPPGGITVWLGKGNYFQADTLAFEAADSGTADRPIVYSSLPLEDARVTGARALDASWFARLDSTSPVWSRLDNAARGQVYAVDLRARGITDYGTFKQRGFVLSETAPLELFFNGKPMTLGRWPNRGSVLALTAGAPSSTQIVYSGARPERWSQAPDIWMHGLWSETWADYHVNVAEIDTGSKTIRLATPPAQYGTRANRPYYAYNLLEEIDEPGEYYLDRGTGVLYFWPTGPLGGADILVSTLEKSVVRFDGAHHVKLRNLTLEASRGPLLRMDSGSHISLEKCILRNAGQYGAQIGGTQNGLDHCEISDCGEEGVRLVGGDRASLTAAGNYVRHSQIRRTGATAWTYKPGVNLEGGCGNIISHNLLEDMPHSAILFSGNNHAIEYNEITRVCQETSDAGAIYSGHDWGYRGNVIRFNFLHHIQTRLAGYGAHGVYLDDCVSGVEVTSNVFYRVSNTAIFFGGGRDNIARGNVVALSGTGHHSDDRGRYRINNSPGDYWNLLERLGLEGIRYREQPWASAYPALAAIPDSWDQVQQGLWRNPQNSVFSSNAGWSNDRWLNEQNDSGTGVFSVYASMTDNNASISALFDENASVNRAARAQVLSAPISGFAPILFAAIGPLAAPDVVTRAPTAPVLEGRAVSSSQIDLSWSRNADGPVAAPLGLELERRNDPATAWQAVQSFTPEIVAGSVTGLSAGTSYSFRVRIYNGLGGNVSNVVTIPTPALPVAEADIQIEAEAGLVVVSDVGGNGSVGVSDGTLDSVESVRLYDAGDAVRLSFQISKAGTYRLGMRVRAGGTTGATAFWPDGYRFKLDGASLAAIGDPSTISPFDPAYGGCHWGTMFAAPVTLAAGLHTVEMAAASNWAVADFLRVSPVAVVNDPPVSPPAGPPILTLPSDVAVNATGAAGAVVTFSLSATDSGGRALTVTSTPQSGAMFPVGLTVVTASVTDGAGRTASGTFSVTVRDVTPPTVVVPGPVRAEATSPAGAVVTFSISADDGGLGRPVSVSSLPSSGAIFPLGVSTVTVTATDAAGNISTQRFTVTVVDSTPPVITMPGNITVSAGSPTGALVTFSVSAFDTVSGAVLPQAMPSSGSFFPVGITSVNVSASDAAGNTLRSSFTVTVLQQSPAVPRGLRAFAGDSTVTLAWDASNDATTYEVRRSTSEGGPYLTIASAVAQPGFSDIGLSNGTQYYYVVAAKAGAFVSANSAPIASQPASNPDPAIWANADVGSVNFAGTTRVEANQRFTISGSGADIWDGDVGFHYAYRTLTGDGTITARVLSVQNTDWWAKAGVMIRESLEPGAPFAAVYLTPGNGAAFQWRPFTWASCSSSQTPAGGPVWVRLQRIGNIFTAHTSSDGSTWTELGRTTISMGAQIKVGMAVTSHNGGSVTTALFDSVAATGTVAALRDVTAPTMVLPAPITAEATSPTGARVTFSIRAEDDRGSDQVTVSSVPASGSGFALGTSTVTATATDAAGNTATQDFTVTVVDSTPPVITAAGNIAVSATSPSGASVGFSLSAFDLVSGAVLAQAMPASGSIFSVGITPVSVSATDAAGNTARSSFTVTVLQQPPAAPVGLRAIAGDGTVTLAWESSNDATAYAVRRSTSEGGPYSTIASEVQQTGFSDTGLSNGTRYYYVVAAKTGGLVSANSGSVSSQPAGNFDLAIWTSADVGSVGFAGNTRVDENQTFTVSGSGTDIWDREVGFQYAYQALTGDGTITARVLSVQNTDWWAKAGVMIRESLDPGAPFAAVYLTPGNGAAFQWRPFTWVSCFSLQTQAVGPVWVRLQRTGNDFTAHTSSDGNTWAELGRTTIAMGAQVLVGMAVTSHNNGDMATALFDSVASTRGGVLPNGNPRPPELVPGESLRIEAESPLVVLRDQNINGSVGVSDGGLDSDRSVRLYDVGDAIQVNFPALAAGAYRIAVRVRAGGTTSPFAFWPDGYRFKLDGNDITLTPDVASLSGFDSSYGGCFWGTMMSELMVLQPGIHSVEITATSSWAVADYVEVTPLVPLVAVPVGRSPAGAWRWFRPAFAAQGFGRGLRL